MWANSFWNNLAHKEASFIVIGALGILSLLVYRVAYLKFAFFPRFPGLSPREQMTKVLFLPTKNSQAAERYSTNLQHQQLSDSESSRRIPRSPLNVLGPKKYCGIKANGDYEWAGNGIPAKSNTKTDILAMYQSALADGIVDVPYFSITATKDFNLECGKGI